MYYFPDHEHYLYILAYYSNNVLKKGKLYLFIYLTKGYNWGLRCGKRTAVHPKLSITYFWTQILSLF